MTNTERSKRDKSSPLYIICHIILLRVTQGGIYWTRLLTYKLYKQSNDKQNDTSRLQKCGNLSKIVHCNLSTLIWQIYRVIIRNVQRFHLFFFKYLTLQISLKSVQCSVLKTYHVSNDNDPNHVGSLFLAKSNRRHNPIVSNVF